jgi:hypothetical protein
MNAVVHGTRVLPRVYIFVCRTYKFAVSNLEKQPYCDVYIPQVRSRFEGPQNGLLQHRVMGYNSIELKHLQR